MATRYGDVTRPCHTFFPVNERFVGGWVRDARDARGRFFPEQGVLPRAWRKNFSLVSMPALFVYRIYNRTHVPVALDHRSLILSLMNLPINLNFNCSRYVTRGVLGACVVVHVRDTTRADVIRRTGRLRWLLIRAVRPYVRARRLRTKFRG